MKAIKYPFYLDTFGKITQTKDIGSIYTDRALTLLSTVVYERPMQPTYGTDVDRALFENGEDHYAAIEGAVYRAMATFLPILKVDDIIIDFPNQDGVAEVTVVLALPDGTTNTVTVQNRYLNSDGTIVGNIL